MGGEVGSGDGPFVLEVGGTGEVVRGLAGFAEDLEVVAWEVPLCGYAAVAGGVDRGRRESVVAQVAQQDDQEFSGGSGFQRAAVVG